jgi:hypothetical protein
MSYAVTFTEKPGYLHFVVTGESNKETVLRCLEDVANVCQAQRIRLALLEERLKGPHLETMELFEVAEVGSERYRGVFTALAYVELERPREAKFAETVAFNRGINVRVCSSVAEAEEWLRVQLEEHSRSPGE